jgi:hypothetical protein
MEILVTDITNMRDNFRCLAGWCEAEHRMVRPLPDGHNWPASTLQALNLTTGCTIEVTPAAKPTAAVFPHATEDMPIKLAGIVVKARDFNNWFAKSGPIIAADLETAFSGCLEFGAPYNGIQQGLHVTTGKQCSSLVGFNMPTDRLLFREKRYPNKPLALQAVLTFSKDGSYKYYSMPVVSSVLKSIWENQGLNGIREHLPKVGNLHVRVGLARGWPDKPNYCTVMLNSVLW